METITPMDMAVVDENSDYLGVPRRLLMENAGRAVAAEVARRLGSAAGRRVVVLAGLGNNGGDGFVAARHLAALGARVTAILLGAPEEIRTAEARANWLVLERMKLSVRAVYVRSADELLSFREDVLRADAVIDAIFGTGIRGRIREPHSTAIDLINGAEGLKVSVDVPSGLNPETGEVHDKAVRADVTVTMHRAKPGLVGRREYVGDLVVADIGVPPEAELMVGPGDVRAAVKPRRPYAKKGDHGRVLVVGGSVEYSGAPALTAMASLRAGADLAIVAAPEAVADAIRAYSPNLVVRRLSGERLTQRDLPRLMELLDYCTSVAVGPGLGLDEETVGATSTFLGEASRRRPLVVDADAIKALARNPVDLSGGRVVITPHAGEFQTLTGRRLEAPGRLAERVKQVVDAAGELGVVLLLKAHEDIISDGRRYKVNTTGNPGMTAGGTGDVLTGVVAAILGWGVEPFRAACASAFINGMAGDLAVAEKGYHITATDVIEKIPEVMRRFEKPVVGSVGLG